MVSDRGLPRAMMIPEFSYVEYRLDVHMMLVDCYSLSFFVTVLSN